MIGAYVLVMSLRKDSKIHVGKLGLIDFNAGYYCYVGSARGKSMSLENRTERHRRTADAKKCKIKWHIDYFLINPNVSLVDVKKIENGDECVISKRLQMRADRTIERFGSSDCESGCAGHLHYFRRQPKAL